MFRNTRRIDGGRGSSAIRRDRAGRGRFRLAALEQLEERLVLAPAATTLAVSAVVGVYGGTATVTANLTSTGTPVAGESVDLHIGATDLGPVVTNTSGNATISAASLANINVGTYTGDVTATFAGDSSFDPASGANDLTVTPAALTITADPGTKVYGTTTTFAGTEFTTSTLFNGDTVTSATLTSAGASATATVAGSPYLIVPSAAVGTGLSNYTITYTHGNLTVTPAPLTITANNLSKLYGATTTFAGTEFTTSTLFNGDTVTGATLTSAGAAPTATVAGSPYPIVPSAAVGTGLSNYTINYANGHLTVNTAPLTITPDDQTKVYGGPLPTFTATGSGFENGDTLASLTTQPTITTTATAASPVSGSPYTITASGAVDPNYTITYGTGNLTVTPAPLTITANNQTGTVGAPLPTLTASYTGLVNGDTSSSLTTPPTLTTTATTASPVGVYPISATGAVDDNYTISYVPGSLTLTASAAATSLAVSDASGIYGGTTTLTATLTSGGAPLAGEPVEFFVGGTDVGPATTDANGLATLIDASLGTLHAGTYTGAATADFAGNSSHQSSTGSADLTVTPAKLTITANDATKVYGAALPTLTATYTGFVNGDTAASLTTAPTLSTTATAASHVSGSPYSITAAGAADPDYTITYVSGALTVTPAPLTITAVNVLKQYGLAVPTLTAAYTGFVNGDTAASLTTPVSLASSVTAATHFGVYPITASGATSTDYTITFVNGAIAVTPAILTVTPVNVINSFGLAVPTLTAAYTGFYNGDTSASLTSPVKLSNAAVAGSPVGVYFTTASGGASADYTIQYGPGAVAIVANPGGVAFLNSLYQSILGRPTETFGFVYWLTALADGTPESDVANNIYNSAEAKQARANNTVPFITEQAAYQKALVAQAAAENQTA